LQGFITFENRGKRLGGVRQLLPGCHLEIANGTAQQNRAYCSKTRECDARPNDVFHERGSIPITSHDKGQLEKARWDAVRLFAESGRLDEIESCIYIRYYSSLKRIAVDHMPRMERLEKPCGVWIYGEAGTGKSRSVNDAYPELFPKPKSIWWDGYNGEQVVLLDDVDIYDVKLGGLLKHWSDCYPFIGESKGFSRKIRPIKFFVTSQYRIEDIWCDIPTQEALKRRFHVIVKVLGQGIII